MKIERVDDKTVKCYLSLEELEEYHVDYRDFLSRSEKAQRLMQEIIRQAREEVDYKPPKLAFEMQIMMVPDQGMVLTFSEQEPLDLIDESKMAGFLQSLKDLISHVQQYREEKGLPGIPGLPGQLQTPELPKGAAIPAMPEMAAAAGFAGDAQVQEAVFRFDFPGDVMEYASHLPAGLRVRSELYKMDDWFYLHLSKGTASYDNFSRACVHALEFGALSGAGTGCDEVLKEHGECIISEKAIKKLGG
ncbi:MAG: adaptor protein MecA [Lachnospiraceae bacterium]|nr:adaptor protein MecA [Lachnospiraceae bacterium]